MLFVRALLAFLALPTLVAGVLPALIARRVGPMHDERWIAWAVLTLGLTILGWCVRDFYAVGRGTLAPWDPPRRLVVVGLYRWTRNPMYVGVVTILAGWWLLFPAWQLGAYALGAAVAVHCRVVWHEEPWLERRFGDDWRHYRARTSRWLPRWPRE